MDSDNLQAQAGDTCLVFNLLHNVFLPEPFDGVEQMSQGRSQGQLQPFGEQGAGE